MFEKKSPPEPIEAKTTLSVSTMPLEFYGGVNPVVKFKTVEKEVEIRRGQPALSSAEKKSLDKATAPGSGQPLHPVTLLSNRKFLIIGGAVLFAVVVIGASWYYWRQAVGEQARRAGVAPAPNETVVSEVETPTSSRETPVVPAIPEAPVTPPPSLAEAALNFPSPLLGDTADLDRDGLSDAEEELFKTDPGVPDSDRDGYSDSHEIYNLYNPIGQEPMRLSDSGLVKEFISPTFGYKLYHPVSWAVGNVDENYRDMLFSTLTGENVEVRVFDKESTQSFSDWFGQWAPTERFGELVEFATAFKERGWRRSDYLVYYFASDRQVYVIMYHTTDSPAVNYRTVIKMMVRSFRLAGNNAAIANPIVEGRETAPSTPTTTPTSTTTPPPSSIPTPTLTPTTSPAL